MIGFFPERYPDELLYSQLRRYFQRTGYTNIRSAIDDLYMHRTAHPVVEWVNEYTPDAMAHITEGTDFETVIRQHTMFPAYTRFLPKKRRNDALHSLLICDGNYYNLIVNQNLRRQRFLRYCPACAKEDRARLGETYWHREHQIIHVNICPKHRCFLQDSSIPIGSKATPGLYAAEAEVPFDAGAAPCLNDRLIQFTEYILQVFRAPVDMASDVPIGSFLRSRLADKYQSESKTKVYSTQLYEDYCSFFRGTLEPMSFEGFRKIYNNYGLDHFRIYQLAYFQGIPAAELSTRPATLVCTAMEELYHDLGLKYGVEDEIVRNIGEAVIARYRSLGKVARKSGPKQREWAELDEKYLPRVKQIVDGIYGADGKPDRVSVTRVERELGAPSRQFKKLPKCTQYVEEHLETNNEFRARKLTWAVKLFQKEGLYMSMNKLIHFLNFRRNDLDACLHFISDPEVAEIVEELRTGMTFPRRPDG